MSYSVREIGEKLRRAGCRLTAPRKAVLQVLAAADEHVNPAEILERARKTCPTLGRATVYRTLELLAELGVIRPIYLGDGTQRYTNAEGGHHHLVCSDCGTVIEFDECATGKLARSLSRDLDFEISGHLLEFYGRCKTCRR